MDMFATSNSEPINDLSQSGGENQYTGTVKVENGVLIADVTRPLKATDEWDKEIPRRTTNVIFAKNVDFSWGKHTLGNRGSATINWFSGDFDGLCFPNVT